MNIVIQLNLLNEDMVAFKELQVETESCFFFWVTSTTVKTAAQVGSSLLLLCPTECSITTLFTALPLLQRSSAHGVPQGNSVSQGACPHSWQMEHKTGQM